MGGVKWSQVKLGGVSEVECLSTVGRMGEVYLHNVAQLHQANQTPQCPSLGLRES